MNNKKQERLQALENQVARLHRRLAILNQRSNTYSWIRLAIFMGGIAISVITYFLFKSWWFVIPGILFLVLFNIVAYYQRQIDRSITRHNIWVRIKSTQIARIQLDWSNIPPAYASTASADHPFASDLDIIGERSLHQLINTAISYEGCQRVRNWLLQTTADPNSIQSRQALVQELASLTRFRDKLSMKSMLASNRVNEHMEGKRLLAWLGQQAAADSTKLRTTLITSLILSIITITLLLLNLFALLPPQYWILALLASIGWLYARKNERGDLFEDAFFIRDAFSQLSSVFAYLETYPYGKHEHLKKLCEPFFSTREHRPSRLLNKLSHIAAATTLEKNQFFWLIVNVFIPWDAYFALRLNHYKALIAKLLPIWLDTWFELEALNSLASFAYLNPEYVLPTVVPGTDQQQPACFCATGLGHPMIEAEKKVTNDFAMNELGEIVIITGSNMSGKSTFLRTLGVNLCLAYAGGPVNANCLQTSLFRIYTCIKVSDSVTGGYSYFYAEVRRLKALLSELERPSDFPLFFLIDEIFKGTNNRERLIGSTSYIHALVGKNCMGAISTHDLELVKLADTQPKIKNYHFREDVIDGQMVFDYILRPGPCPTTNALKIMQMEGLPVEAGV
ncbi:MAG: MutS family DNA mismatch repair protein [Ktedonobacteraceae bacterium]